MDLVVKLEILRKYSASFPWLKYKDRDGREINMSNKLVKKIVYSHSTDLGIYNLVA